MGAGNCVLANDVPEHREVLREAGIYYTGKDDLKSKIEMLMGNRELIDEKRIRAKEITEKEYSWEKVVSDYEETFRQMMSSSNDL
jgi:glycosyltransferase involved in cell wall biosynthesis